VPPRAPTLMGVTIIM